MSRGWNRRSPPPCPVQVEPGGVVTIGEAEYPRGVGLVGLEGGDGGGALRRVAQERQRAETETGCVARVSVVRGGGDGGGDGGDRLGPLGEHDDLLVRVVGGGNASAVYSHDTEVHRSRL